MRCIQWSLVYKLLLLKKSECRMFYCKFYQLYTVWLTLLSQGYKGSMLKVGGKNGKSATVSSLTRRPTRLTLFYARAVNLFVYVAPANKCFDTVCLYDCLRVDVLTIV